MAVSKRTARSTHTPRPRTARRSVKRDTEQRALAQFRHCLRVATALDGLWMAVSELRDELIITQEHDHDIMQISDKDIDAHLAMINGWLCDLLGNAANNSATVLARLLGAREE